MPPFLQSTLGVTRLRCVFIIKMKNLHTHYDNLKVARNAPPEVIRAAYKTLCRKFHPDHHADNPAMTKTFQLISVAYSVLSDPALRRQHDVWIAKTEARLPDEITQHHGEEKQQRVYQVRRSGDRRKSQPDFFLKKISLEFNRLWQSSHEVEFWIGLILITGLLLAFFLR